MDGGLHTWLNAHGTMVKHLDLIPHSSPASDFLCLPCLIKKQKKGNSGHEEMWNGRTGTKSQQ